MNFNYISGGSSAGSAVAVASDLVAFALETDTAGSDGVSAMFNNVIGLKRTRGLLSTRSVVPAYVDGDKNDDNKCKFITDEKKASSSS